MVAYIDRQAWLFVTPCMQAVKRMSTCRLKRMSTCTKTIDDSTNRDELNVMSLICLPDTNYANLVD
jgi:hypothetical protein